MQSKFHSEIQHLNNKMEEVRSKLQKEKEEVRLQLSTEKEQVRFELTQQKEQVRYSPSSRLINFLETDLILIIDEA